jgi:hypothetical protein
MLHGPGSQFYRFIYRTPIFGNEETTCVILLSTLFKADVVRLLLMNTDDNDGLNKEALYTYACMHTYLYTAQDRPDNMKTLL